jgi:hypothetical protein
MIFTCIILINDKITIDYDKCSKFKDRRFAIHNLFMDYEQSTPNLYYLGSLGFVRNEKIFNRRN